MLEHGIAFGKEGALTSLIALEVYYDHTWSGPLEVASAFQELTFRTPNHPAPPLNRSRLLLVSASVAPPARPLLLLVGNGNLIAIRGTMPQLQQRLSRVVVHIPTVYVLV